ncbi:MAG TPA: hypothetical protein VHU89_05910 [Acidobacteriaceae bacterium]|jgi:hypothetical protein|nr:hypothetical protein [Acidobacteriaceae bacterium]
MDLINRYLQAVRFWLPRKQQDDMIAELSEDIRSEMEERSRALGRPLTEGEVEELLRQRGSPILVANRYLPQQSLIGPLLFPIYRFVAMVVTLVLLVPMFLGWLVTLLSPGFGAIRSHHWLSLAGLTWSHLWTGWFAAMGIVTLVFAILERTHAQQHILECWNPRKLPPVRHPSLIPRSTSAIELAVNLAVLFWWTANMAPPLRFHFGELFIAFTAQWAIFFWATLALTLANSVLASINLVRPFWSTPRITARLLVDLIGAVFFCWLLRAHIVAAVVSLTFTPEKTLAVTQSMNYWLARMFPYAVFACIAVAAANLWRYVHLKKKPRARSPQAAAV